MPRSWVCLFWMAAFGLLALAGCKQEKVESKELDGTWQIKRVDESEKGAASRSYSFRSRVGSLWRIEIGGLTVLPGNSFMGKRFTPATAAKNRIAVDDRKNPKHIDLRWEEEDQGGISTSHQLGVYKLDGDTLTVTLAPVDSTARPETVGVSGTGFYTLTFERRIE